jgi:hypothetical protein
MVWSLEDVFRVHGFQFSVVTYSELWLPLKDCCNSFFHTFHYQISRSEFHIERLLQKKTCQRLNRSQYHMLVSSCYGLTYEAVLANAQRGFKRA